jgi:hypothetical protein
LYDPAITLICRRTALALPDAKEGPSMTFFLLMVLGFVAFPVAIFFFTIAMTDSGEDVVAMVPVSRKRAIMAALKRLFVSILASALLTATILIVRLLVFVWGTRFGGPDTFFAFMGFLILLFPVGIPVFFVAFSILAKRQARKSALTERLGSQHSFL